MMEGESHQPELFDDNGQPTRAHDLVREMFKGGRESESIYLRIVAGMPGTPHPASSTLSERERIDLVQYCRSLAAEPQLLLTNHQRAQWATNAAYYLARPR